MWISLVLIGGISAVVAGGTAYLYFHTNAQLTDKKKSTIFLIVGAVVFLSFLVTTFKHRQLSFQVYNEDHQVFDLKKLLYGGGDCQFDARTRTAEEIAFESQRLVDMYKRNYQSRYTTPEFSSGDPELFGVYQEIIVYYSPKGWGASSFLSYLARQICSKEHGPVVYLKLEKQILRQSEFLQAVGFHTFSQLQEQLCYLANVEIKNSDYGVRFIHQGKGDTLRPYLIIDNFEYLLSALSDVQSGKPLPRMDEEGHEEQREKSDRSGYTMWKRHLFDKILVQIVESCGVNIILNTEKASSIEELYRLQQEKSKLKMNAGEDPNKFSFEYHQWEGPTQYDLFTMLTQEFPGDPQLTKLVDAYKQQKWSSQQVYALVQEARERRVKAKGEHSEFLKEGMFLKDWGLKYNLARYYGLDKAYHAIKSTENRKIQTIRQKVSYQDLVRLQELGLVAIIEGVVDLI